MGVADEPAIDLSRLDPIFEQYQGQAGALIPVLQKAQGLYGYLPREVLSLIARRLALPLGKVYGVATFYAQFYLEKRGRHVLKLCDGTACHVKGAKNILGRIKTKLGVKEGETTPDLKFTIKPVACLGTCFLAPAMMVNHDYYGNLDEKKTEEILDSYN